MSNNFDKDAADILQKYPLPAVIREKGYKGCEKYLYGMRLRNAFAVFLWWVKETRTKNNFTPEYLKFWSFRQIFYKCSVINRYSFVKFDSLILKKGADAISVYGNLHIKNIVLMFIRIAANCGDSDK